MRSALCAVALAVVLGPAAQGASPIAVNVDFNANARPISPLIFGVSYGAAARNAQVGYPLVRWGGNSTTRYNWQADVHNTGSDWYFENIRDCTAATCTGTPPAGNSADTFIAAVLNAGAQPLLTVPTIGWTARADSPADHPFFTGFSTNKYGAQTGTDPWDPPAGNGSCSSTANKTGYCVGGKVSGNDPADTSIAVGPSFDQQWIAHLQATFGTAGAGGVRLYALDNEVMLWNSTHRDVRPAPLDYAGAWTETSAYAAAIKQQDAAARVTGPVTWGYSDLWTSAEDAAGCNCLDGSDRTAHAHLPFVAWYLQQVCANPLAGGAHAIDYLDLHYYPQGANIVGSDDSTTTAALRLRSLKELYDPAWTSESWIGTLDGPAGDDAQWHYTKPNLIPRVRAWIGQYCPGTKLAISEYNWGDDATASGAVAQAELFGIFAREGVDVAARWVAPVSGSRVEDAFRLFLDYDGAGGRVRGESIAAVSASADTIGAYGFRDYGRTHLLLLTNKDTSSQSVAVTFAQSQAAACHLYAFDAAQALHSSTLACGGTTLSLTVPAMSANLLVLPDVDGLFRDGVDGLTP